MHRYIDLACPRAQAEADFTAVLGAGGLGVGMLRFLRSPQQAAHDTLPEWPHQGAKYGGDKQAFNPARVGPHRENASAHPTKEHNMYLPVHGHTYTVPAAETHTSLSQTKLERRSYLPYEPAHG